VVGRPNQDDLFVWRSEDGRSACLGVFDGHGRELGQQAAAAACAHIKAALCSEAGLAALRAAPGDTLHAAFAGAHNAVAQARGVRRLEWGWGGGWEVVGLPFPRAAPTHTSDGLLGWGACVARVGDCVVEQCAATICGTATCALQRDRGECVTLCRPSWRCTTRLGGR
jgi:hypothetical protein